MSEIEYTTGELIDFLDDMFCDVRNGRLGFLWSSPGVQLKFRAIRSLLQSSQPVVTREEIEEVVWSGKNTEGRISDLLALFKSKGIPIIEGGE